MVEILSNFLALVFGFIGLAMVFAIIVGMSIALIVWIFDGQ